MVKRTLFTIIVAMVSMNGFCSDVKQKFLKLYELQSMKSESKKALDPYLSMVAEQLSVADENLEAFKQQVFATWYASCKEAYAELYSQHFSESDVDQMIHYAESDIGVKIAQKQHALTMTLLPVFQGIAQIAIDTAANLALN